MGVEDILEYFQEAQITVLSYNLIYSVDTIICSIFKWPIWGHWFSPECYVFPPFIPLTSNDDLYDFIVFQPFIDLALNK